MAELDRVEQLRKRPADFRPVGVLLVARQRQRVADRGKPRLVAELGNSRPAQQRHQRGIAQRGLVEFGEMLVALARMSVQKNRIADVIDGGAIFAGRQRAKRRARHVRNIHTAAPLPM